MISKSPKIVDCRDCGTENELPFFFCHDCGASRVQLGRLRVILNLNFMLLLFLGYFLLRGLEETEDFFVWPWPIYLAFGLLFYQFTVTLVGGRLGPVLKQAGWFAVVFALFWVYFEFLHRQEAGVFLMVLAAAPEVAQAAPFVFYPTLLGVLLAIFIPCYIRWGARYGWVNGYRLVLASIILLCLALFAGFQVLGLFREVSLPSDIAELESAIETLLTVKPVYDGVLIFVALRLLLIFLAEILIFAAFRGYQLAHKELSERGMNQRATGGSAVEKSMALFAQGVRRFIVTLECMVRYLMHTLAELAVDTWRIVLIFLREVAAPLLTLSLAAVMIHGLAVLAVDYIDARRYLNIVWMLAVIGAALFCMLLFVWSITTFRLRRILAFYAELTSWLLPNLLVFFLLVSLTLAGSGYAISQVSGQYDLPFAIGPLTGVIFVMLMAMAGYVLLTRKGETGEARAQAVTASAGRASSTTVGGEADSGPSIHDIDGRDIPAAKKKGRKEKKDKGERKSMLGGRIDKLQDRLKGRPLILEKLAKFRADVEQKQEQMAALEKSKASITAEMYSRLKQQHEQEMMFLRIERDKLQTEINTQFARKIQEWQSLEDKLADLRSQMAEFDNLQKAGVMSEKQAKAERKKLVPELKALETQFTALDEIVGYYKEWVTSQ